MDKFSTSPVPIQKRDKFSLAQCLKNDLEQKQIEAILCASVFRSIIYAQICTRQYISFVTRMLGRYQNNLGMEHWKATKKVLRYLQGTKDHMLTYRRSDHLKVIWYSDSDFVGCVDTRKSTLGFVFLLAGGVVSWKCAKQSVVTA